jgi:hypothetical protein
VSRTPGQGRPRFWVWDGGRHRWEGGDDGLGFVTQYYSRWAQSDSFDSCRRLCHVNEMIEIEDTSPIFEGRHPKLRI